jgi:putative transposase
MSRKRYTPEQIIGMPRQTEVELARGKRIGISEQSYYRWRSEYGGLKLEQARRMKDLEKENGRLKKAEAETLVLRQPASIFSRKSPMPLSNIRSPFFIFFTLVFFTLVGYHKVRLVWAQARPSANRNPERSWNN